MKLDLLSIAIGMFIGIGLVVIYAMIVSGSEDDQRHGRR